MEFGLYLTKKGVITAEQLVAALERQHSKLVPIGQLAMEEGVLSARDVFDILRCQCDWPHDRFGDMAVNLGLLSQPELERLLIIQAERKPPLTDIFVQLGVLTPGRIDDELVAYRSDMERRKVVVKRSIPATPRYLPNIPDLPDDIAVDAFAMMI